MADAIPDDEAEAKLERLGLRMRDLEFGANGFARAMTSAFTSVAVQGKALDDVLKSLALRLSDMVLKAAVKPFTDSLASGFKDLLGSLLGIKAEQGAIKPFAAGGVIGTPTYFPLAAGGVGLAGEAGPEAIVPLARGPDGRLGVAMSGSGTANVTIHIATPDIDSFRGSEVYLSGQIARAVARGQRGL